MGYNGGGVLLTSTGDIVGQWKKYFEDLFNTTNTSSVEEKQSEDEENNLLICRDEVTKAVNLLLVFPLLHRSW